MTARVQQMGYQKADGGKIRRLREDRTLSIRDLSELSGVSTPTIYQVELGERPRVQPRTLRKLAQALNVLPRELLLKEEDA